MNPKGITRSLKQAQCQLDYALAMQARPVAARANLRA
jgi:hypothetical protein